MLPTEEPERERLGEGRRERRRGGGRERERGRGGAFQVYIVPQVPLRCSPAAIQHSPAAPLHWVDLHLDTPQRQPPRSGGRSCPLRVDTDITSTCNILYVTARPQITTIGLGTLPWLTARPWCPPPASLHASRHPPYLCGEARGIPNDWRTGRGRGRAGVRGGKKGERKFSMVSFRSW